MKLKIILIATGIMLGMLGSFIGGVLLSEKILQKQDCKYYIWQGEEKHCITKKIKQYIENVETGNINRLKSKRGVKIKP